MKILITRPQERIQPLKSKLEDKGYVCISYPLLCISPVLFQPFDVQKYDGIIVTSAHAIPYIPSCEKDIFAVGEGAKTAFSKAHFFSDVAQLKRALDLTKHYLYLRGEYVTDDLRDILHDARIVYAAQEVSMIPDGFDGVVVFSKRTGEIFERLSGDTTQIEVFAFSLEIAKSLKKTYKKIHISQKPTLESMLDLF